MKFAPPAAAPETARVSTDTSSTRSTSRVSLEAPESANDPGWNSARSLSLTATSVVSTARTAPLRKTTFLAPESSSLLTPGPAAVTPAATSTSLPPRSRHCTILPPCRHPHWSHGRPPPSPSRRVGGRVAPSDSEAAAAAAEAAARRESASSIGELDADAILRPGFSAADRPERAEQSCASSGLECLRAEEDRWAGFVRTAVEVETLPA